MISNDMEKALNGQINAELFSAYLYLGMAAYFSSLDLDGFAHWMRIQAQEETTHAMKLYDYLQERGGRVVLEAIDKPPGTWDSPHAAFQATYQHECKVSTMINDLVDLARKQSDHATEAMLQWFVTEQVEEEANAHQIVRKLDMIGDATNGLFVLNDQLGRRAAPTTDNSA